jgi:hypothetical protein
MRFTFEGGYKVDYTVSVNEAMGGITITLKTDKGDMNAVAASTHQVPERVENLFEVLYPKKSVS